MDKKTQKLQDYMDKYLEKTYLQIVAELGVPIAKYDNKTLHYDKFYKLVFKDEITFFLEDGIVSDIVITEFFLGFGIRNIFYFKNENPEYKVAKIFNRKKN
ncbi:hypothetical protein [Chryseobacterium echinoideorum]|uniref:hypothetical protein n=1 Tax=Chryseobacterium echinoideorum TaxID=1549648 RepID=UPI001186AA7C|nr:hypothetical protein [Chryseobacterium echinoideorum]